MPCLFVTIELQPQSVFVETGKKMSGKISGHTMPQKKGKCLVYCKH